MMRTVLVLSLVGLTACSMFKRREEAPATATAATPATPNDAPVAPPTTWDGLCLEGKAQSPIDLKYANPKKSKGLKFHFVKTPATVTDNGQTIVIDFTPGNKADIRGKLYDLVRAEFHSSSEHTLSGNSLPLELQLYHKNDQEQWAVIALFLITGETNPSIEKIWAQIPAAKNAPSAAIALNPAALLPTKDTYYNYPGSLTTPPCTEGVDWNVLNTPVAISKDQIMAFRHLYSVNNRPVQPLNGRKVVNY